MNYDAGRTNNQGNYAMILDRKDDVCEYYWYSFILAVPTR
jgi:hypothetical protein